MMIKKILLALLVVCFSLNISAQITNEGTPASWEMTESKASISAISLPQVDMQKVKSEDEISDKVRTKPYRIGISHKVNYGLNNAGVWTELANGDRIWRIGFNSKDALNLSVVFDQFYIPENANLYLYNNDKTDLVGAYTKINNNDKKRLGSWFVSGDKLMIEYFEPKEVRGEGILNISDVMHGYRLGNDFQKGYFKDEHQKIDDSGDCNHDVNCPIGNDFDDKKDVLKKSVAFLIMPDPGIGSFICTGSLINNTDQDNKPYFLTANHCYERDNGTTRDESLFTMRFNWISPNPDCGTTAGSTNGPTNFVMEGSTLRARNAGSDFMLLELDNDIPESWDVTFAGWDRSDTTPSFQVGIHHPSGDIMKVCRDNNPASKVLQFGTQTWDINGLTNSGNSGNATGWEIGVTEGGSSGSALYDQNGRIIGQLLGGLAACSGTNDNNAHDYYGRFAISWNTGGSAASRLQDWLDPAGTNPTTLDSKDNTLSVNDEFLEENIAIFPNPTSGLVKVRASGLVGDLSYEVFNLLGQSLKSDVLQNESIQLNSLSNNIYFIKIIEVDTNKSLVKKIVLNR
jgi:lysyl endopeptidase